MCLQSIKAIHLAPCDNIGQISHVFPCPCSQPYLLKHTPMKFYLPYLVKATVGQ